MMVACPLWAPGILAKGLCLKLGACEEDSHEGCKALRPRRGHGGSLEFRLQEQAQTLLYPLGWAPAGYPTMLES